MSNKIPIIMALDISSNCTAVSIIHADTGAFIKIYHSLMNDKKKFPTFWSKIQHMKDVFDKEYNANWDIKTIAVEESAKRFSPGFSSADTIITLAKFNAILCYILLLKYSIEPTYVNVRSARSKLGLVIDKSSSVPNKKQIMLQMVARHPEVPWIHRTVKGEDTLVAINQDLADSLVIATSIRYLPKSKTKKKK
jgi:hypothetical protein